MEEIVSFKIRILFMSNKKKVQEWKVWTLVTLTHEAQWAADVMTYLYGFPSYFTKLVCTYGKFGKKENL